MARAEARRLDVACVEQGLFPSRERARAAIMAGLVLVDDRPVTKAGHQVTPEERITLRAPDHPFVSRGGLKLDHALDAFGLDVAGRRALDVGASTGGFTDCLLQRGTVAVCAVDVGYGQIAWNLRRDPRVHLRERLNARYLRSEHLPFTPDLVTIDVSFISLRLVLPPVLSAVAGRREGGGGTSGGDTGDGGGGSDAGDTHDSGTGHGDKAVDILCLVKPQFEAGRSQVGRRGVIRDPAVHRAVVADACALAGEVGARVAGLEVSPVQGPRGNTEFWLHLAWPAPSGEAPGWDVAGIAALVDRAGRRFATRTKAGASIPG